MDTGSIAKPAAGSALNAPQRTDTLAAAGAIKTDLTPTAAVQQVEKVEAVRFEPSNGAYSRAKIDAAMQDVIARRISIDPKTREILYQKVNKETGEVVRQVPDEALMRLRAYAREMREQVEADRTVSVEKVA